MHDILIEDYVSALKESHTKRVWERVLEKTSEVRVFKASFHVIDYSLYIFAVT